MRQVHRHASQEKDYIFELYEMLRRDFPMDKIADWMAINGVRHSNQMVARTFKKAGKEHLVEEFIAYEDINVGDPICSRMTARRGKVIGIHKDGDTIEVRWDVGGVQLLSKESVFKMREKNISDIGSTEDIKKVQTVYDNYAGVYRK